MTFFSRAAFLKSESGRSLRGLLAPHLPYLEGKIVTNSSEAGFGHIDYTVDGEEYTLYPVMPEWCDWNGQIRLEISQ